MLGIFLDSETNGLNAQKHKVIEIAFQIVDVFSGNVLDTFESIVATSSEEWALSDPESLKVNGFTWEEVERAPSRKAVAEQICIHFDKNGIKRNAAVFMCQNPSFDRVFFSQLIDVDAQEKMLWPYHWLDLASMHWVESLKSAAKGEGNFPWEIGYSKDKIAVFHSLPKEEKPHRAMNGVKHLLLCYKAVVGFPGSR